jgi:DNA-binding NarL/FixJ family response regulator
MARLATTSGSRRAARAGMSRSETRYTVSRLPDLIAARGDWDGREVLVVSYPRRAPLDPSKLSPAERAMVDALRRGASNADIARDRGTSVLTVAKQVASALRKLGVRRRGELAALATTTRH